MNGKAIRNLVNELPFDVFDFFCDEFEDMILHTPDFSSYVYWEETNANHDIDAVAEDYGFENFEDMIDDGTYCVVEFDHGVLIVE